MYDMRSFPGAMETFFTAGVQRSYHGVTNLGLSSDGHQVPFDSGPPRRELRNFECSGREISSKVR